MMNIGKMVYDGESPADQSTVSTGNDPESSALNTYFTLHLLTPKYIALLQLNQPSVFVLLLVQGSYMGEKYLQRQSCEIIIRSWWAEDLMLYK